MPTGTRPEMRARSLCRSHADPVLRQYDAAFLHTGLGREPGVGAQVPPGAVHRHHVARSHRVVEVQQLACVRMSGNVNPRVGVGHYPSAYLGQESMMP